MLELLLDLSLCHGIIEWSRLWTFAQGYLQSVLSAYNLFRFYEVNLWSKTIAYHRLDIELCSSPLLSKKKKIRGFQKCKVHSCNFKGFKVTSLQSWGTPGVEPGPSAWVSFPMLIDSRGRPGFKSRSSPTLETCNFEALEVTAMYFTFLETSNLFLFGQERSRP